MLPFSKLNKMFFGYFDPDFFLKIMKINNFRGELTDSSAKKEALLDNKLLHMGARIYPQRHECRLQCICFQN